MSSDWFEVVALMDGRTYLQGSNADEEVVCLQLSAEQIAAVEALEARQHAAMQRLLRDMAVSS